MMKRTLIALALFALPALALAQAVDRDTLLTPDGTLYTIESVTAAGTDAMSPPSQYLLLTTQQQGHSTELQVPGSLTGGLQSSPALAFDADSGSLFIFWEHALQNRDKSTSLLFTSFQNGTFGATTEFDPANHRIRHNLRIGVTHKTQDLDKPGQPYYAELNVHAIWEEEIAGEWARYAMLTIEKGDVTSIVVHDALDLNDPKQSNDVYPVGKNFNWDILKHPEVFESSAHDSVDLVYGDLATNAFHRITVKPVVNLRIRIPIGVRDERFGPPTTMRGESMTSTVGALSSNHGLVFYSVLSGTLNYALYKDGSWTDVRSIALSDKVTADVAVNALNRLMASN
jgi:hypothetical protein